MRNWCSDFELSCDFDVNLLTLVGDGVASGECVCAGFPHVPVPAAPVLHTEPTASGVQLRMTVSEDLWKS